MQQQMSYADVQPDRGPVLTKAVLNAADRLGLSKADLARVIGVSAPTVTRMHAGAYTLDPASKPYDLSALLVRVYRSLDAITGGDAGVARAWLQAHNTALDATPARALRSVTGLTRVLAYLDARRAVV